MRDWGKRKTESTNFNTFDLKSVHLQTRAKQLEQHVEESGMLEDESKRLIGEEIKALKSELDNRAYKTRQEKRGEETEMYVL